MAQAKRCARHPETETMLSCGRCGDPICPKCMVHTHVGARCPTCAQVKKMPTYDVSTKFLSRAVVTSVVVSVACAVLFILLGRSLLFRVPYLDIVGLVAIGYAVGESVSIAANRRRGRTLQYTVSAGLVLAYLIIFLVATPYVSLWWILGVIVAFFLGVSRVR
jgi:hypothetical protein